MTSPSLPSTSVVTVDPAVENMTQQKLEGFRALMRAHRLDAWWIPSADEHLNEYLPVEGKRREWMTNFSGSAGDALVSLTEAWVFVDSRYYEQADHEVAARFIHIEKQGLAQAKDPYEVLNALAEGKSEAAPLRVGFDPKTMSMSQYKLFKERCTAPETMSWIPVEDNLVDGLRRKPEWETTSPVGSSAVSRVFHLSDEVAGLDISKKLASVRQEMTRLEIDVLPLTKLDQIAWLYNLRGWDIPYNPVFISYAIVTATEAFLFTQGDRVDANAKEALLAGQVQCLPYEGYRTRLTQLSKTEVRVGLDPKHLTLATYLWLTSSEHQSSAITWGSHGGCTLVEVANPVERLKAVKNPTEIRQMKLANIQASRAIVRTLAWIAHETQKGQTLSELDVSQYIEKAYEEEPNFQGLSFNSITGAGANSSIVHYGTPDPQKTLEPGQFFLLDSGAQYLGGTTDCTRTVIIGEPDALQIQRYTAVLVAHIRCMRQKFPKGTNGIQLDAITRANMWNLALDFGHGTGHGVGAFLNVHEGPNGIHRRAETAFEPGMITSVEPGFYEPGWGGIRIENLSIVVELRKGDDPVVLKGTQAPLYGLDALLFVPFEKKLIDLTMLDTDDRAWLKAYNEETLEKLLPTLEGRPGEDHVVNWLKAQCDIV